MSRNYLLLAAMIFGVAVWYNEQTVHRRAIEREIESIKIQQQQSTASVVCAVDSKPICSCDKRSEGNKR